MAEVGSLARWPDQGEVACRHDAAQSGFQTTLEFRRVRKLVAPFVVSLSNHDRESSR